MRETRDFPTKVIASLSSDVLLCSSFSDVHVAAEFLMGHPIWTHHFANKELWREIQKTILEQCPGMPTDLPGVTRDNLREYVSRLEADLGPTVRIRKGGGLTALLPTDGLPQHMKDHTIIVETKK